jgi:hypothetical protein
MALDMMHPEDNDPFTVDGLNRMQQGREMEELVIMQLSRAGAIADPKFSVIQRQTRIVIKDRDGLELIVAKIDGRLKFEGEKHTPITEIKWGRSFMGCESVRDLDAGEWTRAAVDQMLCYLLGMDEPLGVFVLPRVTDFPTLIPVVLDQHLARAEAALVGTRKAVLARTSPNDNPLPTFTTDSSLCRRCPHLKKTCLPPAFEYGDGVTLIADDEVLLQNLLEREATAGAHRQYERADKAAKTRLRDVAHALCGPFEITGRWSPQTRYELPDDVKAQYAIEEEKGRFTVSIERAV